MPNEAAFFFRGVHAGNETDHRGGGGGGGGIYTYTYTHTCTYTTHKHLQAASMEATANGATLDRQAAARCTPHRMHCAEPLMCLHMGLG